MNIRLGLEQMGHGMHDLSPFLDNLNFKHLIGIRKDLKKNTIPSFTIDNSSLHVY